MIEENCAALGGQGVVAQYGYRLLHPTLSLRTKIVL